MRRLRGPAPGRALHVPRALRASSPTVAAVDGPDLSGERIDLIGAYLTQEYAIEGAALFNPSIVAHPDQSGRDADELRFVMSVRAVGEGHWSSVEFRTGVLGADHEVRIDEPGRLLSTAEDDRRPVDGRLPASVLGPAG